MSDKVFYFGCWDDTGHRFYAPRGACVKGIVGPWGYEVDGKLCPPGPQKQGVAALHHKDGWTALAFWDRSVDSRPGSCSVFLTEEELRYGPMIVRAVDQFPEVFGRFSFMVSMPGETLQAGPYP